MRSAPQPVCVTSDVHTDSVRHTPQGPCCMQHVLSHVLMLLRECVPLLDGDCCKELGHLVAAGRPYLADQGCRLSAAAAWVQPGPTR